jgi:hypothetical protein
VAAVVLGDELGMLSVAIAWAVGYPLAFLVLLWMAVHSIKWKLSSYLRSIAGVSMCMIVGALVGFGVHWLVGSFPAVVRLGVSAGAIVVTIGLLLAYTQGISIRSVLRGIKTEPVIETPPVGTPVVK